MQNNFSKFNMIGNFAFLQQSKQESDSMKRNGGNINILNPNDRKFAEMSQKLQGSGKLCAANKLNYECISMLLKADTKSLKKHCNNSRSD